MTPDELWPVLMPIVGPLKAEQRVRALAYVLDQTRGKAVLDDESLAKLIGDVRKRFGGNLH